MSSSLISNRNPSHLWNRYLSEISELENSQEPGEILARNFFFRSRFFFSLAAPFHEFFIDFRWTRALQISRIESNVLGKHYGLAWVGPLQFGEEEAAFLSSSISCCSWICDWFWPPPSPPPTKFPGKTLTHFDGKSGHGQEKSVSSVFVCSSNLCVRERGFCEECFPLARTRPEFCRIKALAHPAAGVWVFEAPVAFARRP